MHLALELDQSSKVSANPKADIERALQVLRKRIDEFGVTEPLVQQEGDDRIVVELAGIADPARAKSIVQKSAFLEFRITDKSGALERAMPSMERALRTLGINAPAGAPATPSAVEQLLGGDSAKAASDTASITGGVLCHWVRALAPVELCCKLRPRYGNRQECPFHLARSYRLGNMHALTRASMTRHGIGHCALP
jgi:hypothetical protein